MGFPNGPECSCELNLYGASQMDLEGLKGYLEPVVVRVYLFLDRYQKVVMGVFIKLFTQLFRHRNYLNISSKPFCS